MSNSFQNQTAVVTGAGRGIGAETAKLFSKKGANVVLVSKTKAQLNDVAGEIQKENQDAKVLVMDGDVSDEVFSKKVYDQAVQTFGSVEILVNNAAVIFPEPILESSSESWKKTLEVNVLGSYYFAKEHMKRFQKSHVSGSIVNISSLAGIKGTEKFPGFGSYTVSKHAVVGLTEALSVEAKALSIRVNCVAPGAVDTQMLKTAAPHIETQTKPSDIANVIVQLCDEKVSRAIHGSVIEIHSNG